MIAAADLTAMPTGNLRGFEGRSAGLTHAGQSEFLRQLSGVNDRVI